MASGSYAIGDFRAGQTAGVVDLWNRSAPTDPMTVRRFRDLILLDPNFDPAGLQVASVRDTLVGAVYAVRRTVAAEADDLEPDNGWIVFFFVDPEHRRRGIGRALLDTALRWLAEQGRGTVTFSGYTPNYVLPGLDADTYPAAARLLDRLGFGLAYESVAMDRDLVGYEIPPEVRAQLADLRARGYRLGPATDDDLVDLIPLARRHFNPDWGRAIREGVAAGMPADRIVVAREPAGRLVGWAMHGTYEGVVDRFGPFGVLAECRGAGLGRALLHLTLERMRAVGAHSAWFLWTDESSAAGQLYRKSGFTVTRTFRILRRVA
jgi:GNAT superfamily N-acetyltransferase